MSDILTNLTKNIPKYVPEITASNTEDGVSVLRTNRVITKQHANIIEGCGETVEVEVLRLFAAEITDFIIKEKLYTISSQELVLIDTDAIKYTVEVKVKK